MQQSTAESRESESTEVNLTPMLDVVFILLIFFIVTASFINERGIPVNRPEGLQKEVPAPDSILVEIDETDRIFIRGRNIDPRAVTANIKRLSAENPDAPVVVRPNAKSSNNALVQVLDSARAAGRFDVALAVE